MRVVRGFTARRPVPKVGRNDPCPCGSGKKYKKCCAEKDAERAADPSPVPGLTRTEYLRSAGEQLTADEVDGRRPTTLAEVDPSSLGTLPLISALRRAAAFRRWDRAERAMEVLAGRSDTPDGDGEGYRVDLISDAVNTGNEATVRWWNARQQSPIARLTAPGSLLCASPVKFPRSTEPDASMRSSACSTSAADSPSQ